MGVYTIYHVTLAKTHENSGQADVGVYFSFAITLG